MSDAFKKKVNSIETCFSEFLVSLILYDEFNLKMKKIQNNETKASITREIFEFK